MTDPREQADARLDAALENVAQRDPRDHYRQALRALKQRNQASFDEALRYFEEELVPAVAGEADPLDAWWAYGEKLAEIVGPGRRVEVDASGRTTPLEATPAGSAMVLHIPDDAGAPVLVMRVPRDPSPAQQATLELLAYGRQTASAYEE